MKVLILNGSPHPHGNTKALTDAFTRGAAEAGHEVTELFTSRIKAADCLGCEYCHTKGAGVCFQKDDMIQVYEAFAETDALVLASPIYYFSLSGSLQCVIDRTYAIGIPKDLKVSALLLSSGSSDVYGPAIDQYHRIFQGYMRVKDGGIITASGSQNHSKEKLQEAYLAGKNIGAM